ncbi:MAG: phage terminase large subunit, partial [Clostridia bacterium]|nr:phage terminase large subunit [Clostridia bacterium]
MIRFNPKQRELIRKLKADELARINILEGAVRSGKTWISLIVFALWVATKPRDATFLMVARTLTTLKRNCLELLQSLVGKDNFTFNLSKKEAKLFGRTVYLEGVNDARAEGKIRGMTLTGAYCDELTLFTEEFFSMLLSRLSMPGAKLFGSTNPDSPLHWLNVKYLKRANELDMLVVKFTILDNKT